MKALISVSDKTGIVDFSRNLLSLGYDIISTGGTGEYLSNNGISVIDVSKLTKFPEFLDGRVKTLNPIIHGGILAKREDSSHIDQLVEFGIDQIDLVVNNLYPFQESIKNKNISLDDILENIDIGGPAMTRAAAKNFKDVLVVVDPEDYQDIINALSNNQTDFNFRKSLASKAFRHVSFYDTLIADYLSNEKEKSTFFKQKTNAWELVSIPRYGENPHQSSAVYKLPNEEGGIVNSKKLHGIDMSYLNYFDADAAWVSCNIFNENCVSIIKHGNPCGLSLNNNQTEAYLEALSGDPVSAFGGIVGFNNILTEETAKKMEGHFIDVIVAPSYEKPALEILRKRKKTRVIQVSKSEFSNLMIRSVTGGFLLQEFDQYNDGSENWEIVTNIEPNFEIMEDLKFAWKVSGLIKSNAIVVAKDKTLIGMGAGQPNRLNSIRLATQSKSGNFYHGSVLASDAFFPFPDNLIEAEKKGIKFFIQPGGSIRDQEIIDLANELNMIMVFTHKRHFLH